MLNFGSITLSFCKKAGFRQFFTGTQGYYCAFPDLVELTLINSGNVALGFRVPLVGSHFAVTTAEADDTDNGNLVFNLEAGIYRTIVIAPVPTLMDLTSNRGLYDGTIAITGGTLGISLVSNVNAEIVIGADARALYTTIEKL